MRTHFLNLRGGLWGLQNCIPQQSEPKLLVDLILDPYSKSRTDIANLRGFTARGRGGKWGVSKNLAAP